VVSKKFFFLNKLRQIYRVRSTSGISLVELLVSIVIAGIAITGLLSAMVQLLSTDQQEAIADETQQEMQTALSFIAEDLREAVYVYDGTQLRSSKSIPYDSLPDFSTVGTPVLAFWKVEPLSQRQQTLLAAMNCNTAFASNVDKRSECENLKMKRRAYSLVVYLQLREPAPNNPSKLWQGKSRILRYELPQYYRDNPDFATLNWFKGFVDPARTNNFPGWPFDAQDANNLQEAANGGTGTPVLNESPPQVLVDFVDDPTGTPTPTPPSCPNQPAPAPLDYQRLPATNTTASINNSFFVCVRTVNDNLGLNQDIILYLRGNTFGKQGTTKDNTLSTLQTRVTLRGVIDKFN
jgi:hypothetical protein